MKARTPAERENEIKLAVAGAAAARALLRRAGFRVVRPRAFESNIVFDTGGRRLLRAGELLRVREVRRKGSLTYKGPADGSGRHKSREEIETVLPDPAATRFILERLAFQPVFRYEKFRTEFSAPAGRGVAMLDETPIGVYLELEGSPRWVDRMARTLGFSPEDYITLSYGRLYRDYCEARGVQPGNMVFRRRK